MAGNYVSETNFHNKYAIEQLKALFKNSSSITVENLYQLINQCFNYELVSGDNIKIVELKSNSDTRNTTRTYKISCTCDPGSGSGSGGGGKEYFVTDGVCWADDEEKDTMQAAMYEPYQTSKDLSNKDVYPVKLSKDGKLIVDLSTLSINASITPNPSVRENLKDGVKHNNAFTFNCSTSGVIHRIELSGNFYNETYGVKYSETIDITSPRSSYSHVVSVLGSANSDSLTIDSIRTLTAKVYYSDNISDPESGWLTKTVSGSMQFIYPIFFGLVKKDMSGNDDSHTSFNPIGKTNVKYDVVLDSNSIPFNVSDSGMALLKGTNQSGNKLVEILKTSPRVTKLNMGCWDEFGYVAIFYPSKYNNTPTGVLRILKFVSGGQKFSSLETFEKYNVTLQGFKYRSDTGDESNSYTMYLLRGTALRSVCSGGDSRYDISK